jgi:glycogen phosphorylase
VIIPLEEVLQAHRQAKRDLLEEVVRRTGTSLEPGVLTIGFARRATAYKRADLLFSDLERLRRIAQEAGPLQVIYAGKAHPKDWSGKELIQRIFGPTACDERTLPQVAKMSASPNISLSSAISSVARASMP